MLGPITFTKNNENSIYSRNNEIIFSNKKIRRVNYHIHGLRSSNNILVSFGSRFLSVFKLNGDLEKEIIIDTWILDVLIADNIYIGTYKGEVLNIRKEIIFKADLSSISCLTFISPKEILCGAYGFIWAMEKYKIHKGRVFDCCVNKYGFVSSGEERIVFVVDKNGYWVIQELRNYVVKCGIYKNFVYTINKDGTFKVYYKRRLVFVCYSDVLCLSDCLISDDYLFLGYSHGKIRIFEIKMNCKIPVFIEKDLNFFSCSKENGYNLLKIKNIRLNDDENMINEYPVSKDFIIDNIISYSHERNRNFPVYKIPSISIYKIYRRKKIARNISCYCWKNKLEFVDSNGLYNKFLQLPIIPKEILSDDSFVYGYKDRVVFKTVKTTLSNNCTTKLDHHTKKISSTLEFVDQNIFYFNQSKRYLILLCRDKVIYIRKTDMKKYKELHVSSPVISKKNLIGTKYGWIIYKNKGFKIANEPILDLYRKKNMFIV